LPIQGFMYFVLSPSGIEESANTSGATVNKL
jgi:hypothetical protein